MTLPAATSMLDGGNARVDLIGSFFLTLRRRGWSDDAVLALKVGVLMAIMTTCAVGVTLALRIGDIIQHLAG